MWEHTKKAIKAYQADIINRARKNLSKKNASGALSKSLEATKIKETDNKFSFGVDGLEYGEYVDKGVSGIKKKYATKYSYKSKMPPPSKLDKWTVRRGIAPRDAKGRFINRKSLQFLIARSIYNNGLKPSHFMTNALNDSEKVMMPLIQEAMIKDLENSIENEYDN